MGKKLKGAKVDPCICIFACAYVYYCKVWAANVITAFNQQIINDTLETFEIL